MEEEDVVFCEVQPGDRFYAHKVKQKLWGYKPPDPYTGGEGEGFYFVISNMEGAAKRLVRLETHLRQADWRSPMNTAVIAQGFAPHIANVYCLRKASTCDGNSESTCDSRNMHPAVICL